MAATVIELADAVVTELNAETFSQAFTAQRFYTVLFELKDMQTLHVSVVPRAISTTALNRSQDTYEYQIDIAIQKRDNGTLAASDALMQLVEEIADHMNNRTLADCRCVGVSNAPIYSPDHLQEFRQFTSVLTLTFRKHR
jgi:restriction endonuclease Mrr